MSAQNYSQYKDTEGGVVVAQPSLVSGGGEEEVSVYLFD